MTEKERRGVFFTLAWAFAIACGVLLNAATWIVTGSAWNLFACLFGAATAMWLVEDVIHG